MALVGAELWDVLTMQKYRSFADILHVYIVCKLKKSACLKRERMSGKFQVILLGSIFFTTSENAEG